MGATLRFLCLAIGGLFLLAGFGALGYELRARVEGMPFELQPLGQIWYDIDAGSLNLFQAVVERYVSPDLWDPVILTVLYWPAVLVFLIPGAVLFLLCALRRRRRRAHLG